MSAGRRYLLSGAAGFIGSHVGEALLRRGDAVVAIDSFDAFYDPAIKRRNLGTALANPRFSLVEGDIRDRCAMERVLAAGPYDGVVHLAARAGVRPSIDEPLLYEDVNVRGTSMLLELARRGRFGHLVLASSSSVYGSDTPVPFRESQPADRPASPYAATKRANELTAHTYHHLYGHDITCLRFFTVYGPRQRPEMAIHKFTRQIHRGQPVTLYGDGSARRDFTYIDDIVGGVVRALDRPGGYRILNLGTTVTTRVSDLIEMIAERLCLPARIERRPAQPGDVPITFADITAASEQLGYHPTVTIEAGLDRFVPWYQTMAARVPGALEASEA